MRIRVLIAAMLLTLCAGLMSGCATAEAAVDYEALRSSVFRVVVTDDAQTPTTMGSGFAVGAAAPVEYIITCYHVIKDNPDAVYVWDTNQQLIPCQVIKAMEDIDVAILKTQWPVDRPPLPLGREALVKASDDVYAYGFPTGDVSDYQLSQPENVTITKGVVSKKTEMASIDYYQTDVTINQGSSGGPLIHKDGYVIGINALIVQGSINTNASIMIDQVLPALGELGITYLSPDPNTPSAAEPVKPQGSAFWLFVFIFAGIAFLAVLGYLGWQWWRARGVPEEAALAPRGGPDRPALLGVGGQYDGALIPFEGQITIGRDPGACQLVYPKDTPGVSRVHCQVRYDERSGTLVLKDLSSGGTSVGGSVVGRGRAVSLAPGDVFYLADTGNGFRAEVGEA